jgi:hypothetical protein
MAADRTRVSAGFTVAVGNRVRFSGHGSKTPDTGHITRINGAYIYVMVTDGSRFYDVECLENEIKELL